MLQIVAEKEAFGALNKYINILRKTGYTGPGVYKWFLLYIFLIDFLEYTHDFFSDDDYVAVTDAFSKLSGMSGCLVPYPVFCTNRATLGRAHYIGPFKVRVSEAERVADRIKRVTQEGDLRTV